MDEILCKKIKFVTQFVCEFAPNLYARHPVTQLQKWKNLVATNVND